MIICLESRGHNGSILGPWVETGMGRSCSEDWGPYHSFHFMETWKVIRLACLRHQRECQRQKYYKEISMHLLHILSHGLLYLFPGYICLHFLDTFYILDTLTTRGWFSLFNLSRRVAWHMAILLAIIKTHYQFFFYSFVLELLHNSIHVHHCYHILVSTSTCILHNALALHLHSKFILALGSVDKQDTSISSRYNAVSFLSTVHSYLCRVDARSS